MASSDAILSADFVQSAIAHMNEDHADAVLAYARGLAGLIWAESAELTQIDINGMELLARGNGQETTARVAFDQPLTEARQLRQATVDLARRARAMS